eukprot:gene5703-6405_t
MSAFWKNVFPFFSKKERKKENNNYIRGIDPAELWEIIGELGDGTFGKVYKAKRKSDGLLAAAKIVPIKDETELEDFMVEIDILAECKHKHVVDMYQAYVYENNLWMLLEFCPGGAMDDIVLDLERGLDENAIRVICRQMTEGLCYLHQCGVIHRDLKAGNVLLREDGNIKLADFGVSAKNKRHSQRRDTFIGTPYWMAPEVVITETSKDDPYDYCADIWSLGITMIELAEMQPPYHEMHPMRVLFKITKSSPPTLAAKSNWSADFHQFIADCLNKDASKRPSAADLLTHSFIREISDNQPLIDLYRLIKTEVVETFEDLPEDKENKDGNGNGIIKSFSSDTLDSMATEDDSGSSQKDDTSTRDSDSGIPPMPLRRIKEISEYDDVNQSPDITKVKSKEPVVTDDSNAELVGFKSSEEAAMRMKATEDAVRNDLPSLEKRGEMVAILNKTAAAEDVCVKNGEGEEGVDVSRDVVSSQEEEKAIDKYSSRFDDALAKLEEESGIDAASEADSKTANAKEDSLPEDNVASQDVVSSATPQGMPAGEGDNQAAKQPVVDEDEDNRGEKKDVGTEEEVTGNKGASSLKAELDKLKLDQAVAKSDDSTSTASNSLTSPKRSNDSKQYKTLTRVRKYEKDGQIVTETTSRIVDVQSEDYRAAVRREQQLRKQALNEMKILRREESKQGNDLMAKITAQWTQTEEKFRIEEEELKKSYELKLEVTCRQQKRDMEKFEVQQHQDMKVMEKKLKVEQEKRYKEFKESLKDVQKVLKKETDKMPKSVKKEEYKRRKEILDYSQQNQEREFKFQQTVSFERFHREKTEEITRKIFEMEMEFLEFKHNLLRAWKSEEWEMEQNHLHSKHQLTRVQLQDTFFLQRSQMAARHQKEIEQNNRLYKVKEEEMKRRNDLERKRLPKIQRNEIKNKSQALRRQLRADRKRESIIGYINSEDKERIKEFEEALRRNAQSEFDKLIIRQEKEEEELKIAAVTESQELKQLQNEKRHMLIQSESEKLKDRDDKHASELEQWKEGLVPRKRALEDEFAHQKSEQRQFYYQLNSPNDLKQASDNTS